MTVINADDHVLGVLAGVHQLTEVRDSNGQIVGYYAPASLQEAAKVARAAASFDRNEIERIRRAGNPKITTRQLFQRLQSLTDDEREKAELQKLIDARPE
ncbi:MAG TPA: hypothetical protein VGZ47_08625 [Gemmataceae bacterium]|jgi:hypothetical protein|nr:hypothetical protein [Gemmataceae bacterium]